MSILPCLLLWPLISEAIAAAGIFRTAATLVSIAKRAAHALKFLFSVRSELYDLDDSHPHPRLRSYREILNRHQVQKNLAPLQSHGLDVLDLILNAIYHIALLMYWSKIFVIANVRKPMILQGIDSAAAMEESVKSRLRANMEQPAGLGLKVITATKAWKSEVAREIPKPAALGFIVIHPEPTHGSLHPALEEIQWSIDYGQRMVTRYLDINSLPSGESDVEEPSVRHVWGSENSAKERKRASDRVFLFGELPLVMVNICKAFSSYYVWAVGVRLRSISFRQCGFQFLSWIFGIRGRNESQRDRVEELVSGL